MSNGTEKKTRQQRRAEDRKLPPASGRSPSLVPPRPGESTDDVTISLPLGPDPLQAYGPMLECTWSLPRALQEELAAAGKPIPAPAKAWMLLDTGASRTVIDTQVVDELGLQQTGSQKRFGAQGEHDSALYRVCWSITVSHDGAALTKEMEVGSAPTRGGYPKLVIGMIGRDILRHTLFHYNGIAGVFELTIGSAAFKRTP